MIETESEDFRNRAKRNTLVRIDGAAIDLHEVRTTPTQAISGDEVPVELMIDRVALLHELNEAGVEIGDAELEGFVQGDVAQHPEQAINGYLSIAAGILSQQQPQRVWGIFSKKRASPVKKWTVVRIDSVGANEASIQLIGKARVC